MEVFQGDVDGVPVFWAEGGDEYKVALMFRVGRADESLARGGITHLVEHLALHGVGGADYHHNGAVDATTTMFVSHGDRDEVTAFLTALCDSLRDLPTGRLEAEKQILRTEAEGRGPGPAGRLSLWRYGAASYGLPAYEEFGLGVHGPDDVKEWAARWFTRGNAALAVIGGPPPPGLRLNLPDGERRAAPAPTIALPRTPAYFNDQIKGLALSGIVARSSAAGVYATLLERRLHKALRLDSAFSYTTQVVYSPRTSDTAQVLAFADGLAESHPRLTPQFIDEFERAAAEPADAEELADAVSARRALLERRDAVDSLVAGACWNELMGASQRSIAEIAKELDVLSAADVQAVGRQVLDSGLLMLPHGQQPNSGRFTPAPEASVVATDGLSFARADENRMHLIVGPTGVTLMHGPTLLTVRHDACAAMLSWPDGARHLIGLDGTSVAVEPNRWVDGDRIPAEIDRAIPADRVVPMPARSAEDIPEPPASPASAASSWRRGTMRRALSAASELIDKFNSIGLRPAWSGDTALRAAVSEAKQGRLTSGLDLLARSRRDFELRALYASELAVAAVGHSSQLASLAVADPENPDLSLWLGTTRIKEAWKARSRSQAEYVSSDQFDRFWLLLAGAGEPLHRAATLFPEDPVPWDGLQWHAIGLQLGRAELDRVWEELHSRHPALYAGHYTRAQALCRKWWGSDAELLDFAETTVESAKPGDPVVAILAVAHFENGLEVEGGHASYMADPHVHGSLVAAADRWLSAPDPHPHPHPRTLEAHHLFGAAFYHAGDFDRARRHLSRTGKTIPNPMGWGYTQRADADYKNARRDLGL